MLKKNIISLFVGFIFALGLGHSSMTKPSAVKGFLDIFGNWNPNLLGVMIGAILVHAIAYQIISKRSSPLFDVKFHIPNKRGIDKKLILGAMIFGVGWGWAGMCPGPAIVSLASAQREILVFVFCMLLGMFIFQKTQR